MIGESQCVENINAGKYVTGVLDGGGYPFLRLADGGGSREFAEEVDRQNDEDGSAGKCAKGCLDEVGDP